MHIINNLQNFTAELPGCTTLHSEPSYSQSHITDVDDQAMGYTTMVCLITTSPTHMPPTGREESCMLRIHVYMSNYIIIY